MSSRTLPRSLVLAAIVVVAACDADSTTRPVAPKASAEVAHAALTPTVFATGFIQPRGMTFGPAGWLYVAEAGSGGTTHTKADQCRQVQPAGGPYANGPTARISLVDLKGNRTTLASGFPSGISPFQNILGVADVALLNGKIYALVAGGGCSHGSINVPAGVALVSERGQWSIIADISAFLKTHPVQNPPPDFEPDGALYSMIRSGSTLVALEPNHGDLLRIDPATGTVTRILDISASQGHIVPTVVAQKGTDLYFGNLGQFPIAPGTQNVWKLTSGGTLSVFAAGFTTILGLDFDAAGNLYVLENTTVPGFPTPNSGRVTRIGAGGTRTVVVDNLDLPTSIRVGPDGKLYIAVNGFGPPIPGSILRVDLSQLP